MLQSRADLDRAVRANVAQALSGIAAKKPARRRFFYAWFFETCTLRVGPPESPTRSRVRHHCLVTRLPLNSRDKSMKFRNGGSWLKVRQTNVIGA